MPKRRRPRPKPRRAPTVSLCRVQIRLTDEERDELERRRKGRQVRTLSELIRQELFK